MPPRTIPRVIDESLLQRMHTRLARELAPPSETYVPLRVNEDVAGYVDAAHAQRLADCDRVFVRDQGALTFAPALVDATSRSAAIADVAQTLRVEGRLSAWRDE